MLLVTGCGGRVEPGVTVHVFTNQPGAAVVAAIAEDLYAAGFERRIVYDEVPGGLEIGETVLVHGDVGRALFVGREVASVVSERLGESPVIRQRNLGNHHYTAGNLGLYLYLSEAEPTSPARLVDQFATVACRDRMIELKLFASGEFKLTADRWIDDGVELEPVANWSGQWQQRDRDLVLQIDDDKWIAPVEFGPGGQDQFRLPGPASLQDCLLRRPL
jgi:hypothetical protein